MATKKKLKDKSDKRYRAKITVGRDAEGKPIVKYASGKTKKELEANKVEIRQRHIDGTADINTEVIFTAYAQSWFETYKKPHLSPSSIRNYEGILSKHITPAFDKRQLRAISAMDIQSFMNGKAGCGETTLTYICAILTGAFRKAYAEGIINRDPTVGMIKPKYASKTKRALTDKETTAIMKYIKNNPGTREARLLALLYYTGMRRGEALGLQWCDIDYANKTIFISKDVDFVTNNIGGVKTDTSVRTVPMPVELERALGTGIGTAHVIPSEGNSFLSSSVYTRMWDAIMRALCEIDETIDRKDGKSILTAHYFRHNFASYCYNHDIDVLTAQKWLGHKDPKTTLDVYSHLNEEKEEMNARKIKSAFSKKVAEKLPTKKKS